MAIKSRQREEAITTAIGTAQYPWVNTPSTKFVPEGEYSCNIILTKEEGEAIIKKVEPILEKKQQEQAEESGKKVKTYELPIQLEGDTYVLKAKLKPVNGKRKDGTEFTRSLGLFDSKGNPWDRAVMIRGGSKVRLNVRPKTWFSPLLGAGVSLELLAVQVIELADGELSSQAAESFGFTEVEGGYVNGGETLDQALDAEEEEDIIKADF
jgi:opacity protein-like surface antigen